MVEMGLLPSTCLSIMVKHLFLRWLERVESVAASMLLCRGSSGQARGLRKGWATQDGQNP
jgi:hypothetical protein